jgi:hypothetical protein
MLRAILPPLITSYAIFIAMVVVLAVRWPVPRPHGFGRQPFGRVVRTIAGGYVAFLAIVLIFHVWLAQELDALVSAVWGGAVLSLVLAFVAWVVSMTGRRS